ncbi:hypothetical protein REG_1004 [Candidatus Regiella insecticola LSR1]|uniref:Transposase n=2 Tax=Candidatus Regiella insecticola TaxID=138073 RepID=E0WSR4_9ENTR|nr:hypothetical protein [Candidatus Regiella insecticola]EFL92033.1 hypothetical protein REG_1004 [Candidatus Regiella insecticola LSR1]
MEKPTYSEEFKEQALCKVYHRNGRTMKAIADELNVPPRKLRSCLAESELASWCRGQGIFVHHLKQWRADFCDPKRTQRSKRKNDYSRTAPVYYDVDY